MMLIRGETWWGGGTNQEEAETSSDPSWVPSRPFYAQTLPGLPPRVSTDIPSGALLRVPTPSPSLREVFMSTYRSQSSPSSQGQRRLGGRGEPWRKAGPLLSPCGETGAYGHNQPLEEALRRPPLAARGGYPKPGVEGWALKTVWGIGSRNRLTQRDSGRQNGSRQKMRGKGIS